MKFIITILTAPFLFISCTGIKSPEPENKPTQPSKKETTATVVAPQPTVIQPQQEKVLVPQQTTKWQDSPRMFEDLPDALDPASDKELKADAAPIGSVPNNIITIPSDN